MGRRKRKIDMLSGLPDEILYHILSFLPTKLSVSTSVLAKRWRFLWTHVPNLEFHGDNPDNINRVLMLHEANIVNTFSCGLSDVKGCAYLLETCIIYPIKRNVRNLYLDFGFNDEFDIVCALPRRLFTCKTLVDLKLVSCGVIPTIGELFLPSLKKLNLSYVEYESDEALPHLLSGCPVLEELTIHGCFREEQKNEGCIIVSSPTIKTLTVDFSRVADRNSDKMLIIDVPALIYLKVNRCDLDSVESLRKTMSSLIEVDITLNGDWHYCDINCTWHGRSIEFLGCLCHVKCLKIRSEFQEILIDIARTGSMPKFVNLTRLELNLTVIWYDLAKFLEVADNLEVLIIDVGVTSDFKEPERVPPCMLSRLRTVHLQYFNAWENSFEMVRYILRNARALERLEIDAGYISSDKKNKLLDVLRRISLFERGSTSCQLAFNPD